jgi:hypothetical protein
MNFDIKITAIDATRAARAQAHLLLEWECQLILHRQWQRFAIVSATHISLSPCSSYAIIPLNLSLHNLGFISSFDSTSPANAQPALHPVVHRLLPIYTAKNMEGGGRDLLLEI